MITNFFTVHQKADVYYSLVEWALIKQFANTPKKQESVVTTIKNICDALWDFLDGIYEKYFTNLIKDQQTVIAAQ